jgi:hypothetical protein
MTATMIEAALRALLFSIAVGAGLRLFRVSNVPARKAAWSLVLVASLAMPFLMRWPALASWSGPLGWTLPIATHRVAAETPAPAMKIAPVTPAAQHAPVVLERVSDEARDATRADTPVASVPIAISVADDTPTAVTPVSAPNLSGRTTFHWPPANRLFVMLYLIVATILMVRLLWGLAMALRLWSTADLVSPLVAPEPNVRSSTRILSPVTIGSGIVLPASYTEWDRNKLRIVIAHERSHVRQQDFYLQLLAGLYTAIFWFSPLGWWLRRTLTSLGEAIGDRAGMDVAASGSRYAEVLLEFAAMPRQTLPGVAMARHGNLSHRVERLLNEHLFRSAFAEGRRRAMVSLLLIPAALFVATALIHVQSATAQTAPAPPAAPATPAASAAPTPAAAPAAPAPPAEGQTVVPPSTAPFPGGPAAPGVPATPVVAPVVPAPGVPPLPAIAPAPPTPPDTDGIEVDDSSDALTSDDDQNAKNFAFGFSDGGESYAIVEGENSSITFSGNWSDHRNAEIREARKVAKGPFLWFTHEGKSYIVTDPAIIAKVRAMYKPMEPLSHQQEVLGKQQEAFGKQMEDLARQQEAAGEVKMPDLSNEIAELNAATAKFEADRQKLNTNELAEAEAKLKASQDRMLSPDKIAELQSDLAAAQAKWNSEQMAEMESRLGALQARLGELQGEAGTRQGEFGDKMGQLGAQQGALGAEQGRLGAEQGRIAQRADRETRKIIEECLRSGKAQALQQVQ